MPRPNEALMMLRAEQQLPPGVTFLDSTPDVYNNGVHIPRHSNLPPLAFRNNDGEMQVWGWVPEQEYWRPIGIDHPPLT